LILYNEGAFNFKARALPELGQLAPVTTSLFEDMNRDGQRELMIAGNFYESETTQIGKFDASYGSVISFIGDYRMSAKSSMELGLKLDQNQPGLAQLRMANGPTLLVVTGYQCPVKAYQPNHLARINLEKFQE
jgi:enediyne biosynthesis protein E4